MTAALDVQGLNRSFGALHVTREVNLTLEVGARRALIGPNGAGKTTLINLITGALKPSAGKVLLNGEDVTSLSQAQRARRGLARTFQINQLFRGLTVLENIAMTIGERDGNCNNMWRSAGAKQAAIDEAVAHLESLKIAADALQLVRELPYGRQRLLEIAIALAQPPPDGCPGHGVWQDRAPFVVAPHCPGCLGHDRGVRQELRGGVAQPGRDPAPVLVRRDEHEEVHPVGEHGHEIELPAERGAGVPYGVLAEPRGGGYLKP